MSLRQKILEKFIQFYAPFLGAGIKVTKISSDYRYVRVEMPLTIYNRNYVGTQFGGSLYSMVDPWYMLMLIKNLGSQYIVWDKSATIHFKKPGKTKVHAEFHLDNHHITEIKKLVDDFGKTDYKFDVLVKDKDQTIIAIVEKTIYIRKKD